MNISNCNQKICMKISFEFNTALKYIGPLHVSFFKLLETFLTLISFYLKIPMKRFKKPRRLCLLLFSDMPV